MQEQPVKRRRIVVDDSALANRIGERIRLARRQAGLTQQQLADGRYTKAYISALEKGHAKPSMAALNFIAGRLGLPASRFLTDSSGTWDRLSADIALASGDWAAAADAYEQLLDGVADRASRAEILLGLAEALNRLERGEAAIGPATEAVELFTALGRSADAALASYWLSNAHLAADNRAEARAILAGLLADLRRSPGTDPDLRLRILMALGIVETVEEEHHAAIAYFEEAAGFAANLDQRRRAAFLQTLALAYIEVSDVEGAIRTGRESLALYRAADAAHEVAVLENNLALAYLANGNIRRASELAGHARMRHELDGDERSLAHVAETQARIAIAEGRPADAVTLAMEAQELALRSGNARALTSALLTIGRAQASAHDPEAALASYERAVTELRARGPVARLRQGLSEWADVLASMGRHEEAYALSREALHAAAPAPAGRAGRVARGPATSAQPTPEETPAKPRAVARSRRSAGSG
jgi:transcriptional regulator with XRE-family HTH domain